jgi:hypothetical protein
LHSLWFLWLKFIDLWHFWNCVRISIENENEKRSLYLCLLLKSVHMVQEDEIIWIFGRLVNPSESSIRDSESSHQLFIGARCLSFHDGWNLTVNTPITADSVDRIYWNIIAKVILHVFHDNQSSKCCSCRIWN